MTDLPMPPPEVLADPAFHACCRTASAEFFRGIFRRRGMSAPATDPLGQMVDAATGYSEDIGRVMLSAVYDLLYRRLPPAVLAELRAG